MKRNTIIVIFVGIGIGLMISSGFNIMYMKKIASDTNKDKIPVVNNIVYKKEQDKLDVSMIKLEAKKTGIIDSKEHSDKKEVSVIINIPKGTMCEDVAKILKQNNLIELEQDFLNEVAILGLENKIIWGKYEISSTNAMIDIIKKITHKNAL
ncbi:hypothetical protein IZY60_05905 [Lutibacter sp. B2]|nr:hypothetical protein [Lutibacter sp. B2]